MTAQSCRVAEVETKYFARPVGSVSKLSTYRDGWRILRVMITLFKNERPVAFFSLAALALAALSIALSVPVIITFLQTGLVPRFPTAILSASIMLLAFLSVVCGLILDTVTRGRREMKRLAYLQVAAPREALNRSPYSVSARRRTRQCTLKQPLATGTRIPALRRRAGAASFNVFRNRNRSASPRRLGTLVVVLSRNIKL